MANRKLPPDTEVLTLVRSGLSTYQVAHHYGTSRQAVSQCLNRQGVRAPRATSPYTEFIPWRVKLVHNNHRIIRRLRKWARFRLGDTSLTNGELEHLHKWVAWLHQSRLVVDYSPEVGFFYTDRSATLDDPRSIIRRPEPHAGR